MDEKDIKEIKPKVGQVRVGRCVYKGNVRVDPEYKNYTPIMVTCGDLSPYHLKDEKGRLLEHVWQFSQVHAKIPRIVRRDESQIVLEGEKKIIWDHPTEVHVQDGKLTPAYLAWRAKGLNFETLIRYPAGFNPEHRSLGVIRDGDPLDFKSLLTHVEARRLVYLPEYIAAVRKSPMFACIKEELRAGKDFLIINIDGPHDESLADYQARYGVADDFIYFGSMLATKENLTIMLNDAKHPFGHGYCLAAALQDIDL